MTGGNTKDGQTLLGAGMEIEPILEPEFYHQMSSKVSPSISQISQFNQLGLCSAFLRISALENLLSKGWSNRQVQLGLSHCQEELVNLTVLVSRVADRRIWILLHHLTRASFSIKNKSGAALLWSPVLYSVFVIAIWMAGVRFVGWLVGR